MEGKTIYVNGIRIALHETAGPGRAVVFVHGNSASKKVFARQLQSGLADRYRLLALDLPGHGESARGGNGEDLYSAAFFTRTLVGFCKQMNCEDAVLVGSSLGGHIVLESLPLLPESGGAMIFGTPPLENPPCLEKAFLPNPSVALLFKEDLSDDEITLWGKAQYGNSKPIPEFFAGDVKQTDPRIRSGLGACIMNRQLLDEAEIIRKTKCPLAILHGEHEEIANLDYIRELKLPDLWQGDVTIVAGGSHLLQWDQTEQFNTLLGKFLEDLK